MTPAVIIAATIFAVAVGALVGDASVRWLQAREAEQWFERMDAAMADEMLLRELAERADEAGRFPWERQP